MPVQEKGIEPIVQPANPVGFGQWINKVWVPKDGDPNNEQTFLGIVDLINRGNWLAWRCIDIVNGGVYNNTSIQFDGPVIFTNLICADSTYPTLNPARPWQCDNLELASTTRLVLADAVDPDTDYPDAWIEDDGGEIFIEHRPATVQSCQSWIRLRELPDGGLLTDVTVWMQGLALPGAALTNPITYRLARRQARAAIEYLAAAVVDVHVQANYDTELPTVAFSGSHEIDKDYAYYLIVTHMRYAGGGVGARIYNVSASGTIDRLGR